MSKNILLVNLIWFKLQNIKLQIVKQIKLNSNKYKNKNKTKTKINSIIFNDSNLLFFKLNQKIYLSSILALL